MCQQLSDYHQLLYRLPGRTPGNIGEPSTDTRTEVLLLTSLTPHRLAKPTYIYIKKFILEQGGEGTWQLPNDYHLLYRLPYVRPGKLGESSTDIRHRVNVCT